MTTLEDLHFKGGYRIRREEFTRFTVYCPSCKTYEEPIYDYEAALSLLNSHAYEHHGSIKLDKYLQPKESE